MNERECKRLVEQYADMLVRVAYTYLKNREDAKDVCQSVLLRYLSAAPVFENEAHEKAWLIRTAVNLCKDQLKSAWHRRTVLARDDTPAWPARADEDGWQERSEMLELVMALPEKYRAVIYLYYYEEYPAKEIGELLGMSPNAVLLTLSRARKRLKKSITGGQENE